MLLAEGKKRYKCKNIHIEFLSIKKKHLIQEQSNNISIGTKKNSLEYVTAQNYAHI